MVRLNGWLKKQTEDAPLAMRFRGSTAEECKKWQAEFAAKLRSLPDRAARAAGGL